MNTPINITQDNVVIMLLACAVLAFFVIRILVNDVLERAAEATSQVPTADSSRKYARLAAAIMTMRFVTLLIVVSSSLSLALGYYKAFTVMAQLVLPERAFGVVLLIAYCGLFAVIKGIRDEMNPAIRKTLILNELLK